MSAIFITAPSALAGIGDMERAYLSGIELRTTTFTILAGVLLVIWAVSTTWGLHLELWCVETTSTTSPATATVVGDCIRMKGAVGYLWRIILCMIPARV